jgi:citrate synthase
LIGQIDIQYPMRANGLLTASVAAGLLGITRSTLYSYVSRGLIRSEPDETDPRKRRYRAADVHLLKSARERGRRPEQIAAQALDWGTAAIPSRITLVERGRLYYRGRDAVQLAQTNTLEDVARLLWNVESKDVFNTAPGSAGAPIGYRSKRLATVGALDRARAVLSIAMADAPAMCGREAKSLIDEGVSLIRVVAAALLGAEPACNPIHQQVAHSWGLRREGSDLVRSALVLLADHELNASTFAVRVVASTDASLAACICAGLAALSGPLHGGATLLVTSLFEEVERAASIPYVVEERLRRGERLPGFGHPLYPDGDPRADFLLRRLSHDRKRGALINAVESAGGQLPNIDFALVSLCRQLGLPPDAAIILFAIGRTVGWIAHCLEQHADGKLIRPRAHYLGIRPGRAAT